MSFKQAIAYTLSHNLTLANAKSALKAQLMDKKNQIAAFLPSLSLNNDSAWNSSATENSSTSVGAGSSNVLSLELNETLFDSGKHFLNYNLSNTTLLSKRLGLLQTRDTVLKTLVTDYLTFSKDVAIYQQSEQNAGLLKQQYESAEDKYRQGMKTEQSVLSLKTQYEQNQFILNNSKLTVESDQKALFNDLGIPLFDQLRQTLTFLPLKFKRFTEPLPKHTINLKSTYEYKINLLKTSIERLTTKIQNRDTWPKITLSTGPSYMANTNHFLPNGRAQSGSSWQVSLMLKATLFNFGTNWRTLDINAEKLTQTLNLNTLLLFKTQQKLDELTTTIQTNLKNYKLSQSTKDSAEKNYELIDQQFQSGASTITYLNVIDALDQQLTANNNYITSLFQLEQSFYDSLYWRGTLYDYLKKH